jgi:hypothetical protein
MRPLILAIVVVAAFASQTAQVVSAQNHDVKIVDRQYSTTEYTYVAPAYFYAHSSSNVNCYGDVTCSGSTTTTGLVSPARQISFQVRGATFTLQLPDGRAAVVNCESKFAEKFAGPHGNKRSCRIPLVNNIRAEFNGDKAKLVWVVSLDGKKMQSETYKILAILDKPPDEAYGDSKANGLQKFDQPAPANAAPQDVFVWFDESAPGPGAPLFEAVVTARAYDGALAILRQARQGNTSVQTGASVLDTGYHPASFSLDTWQKGNPRSAPSLFYWQGEEVNGATPVMHFQMTKRAYEQMLALVAGSDLRVRPSQTSNH